MWSATSGIDFAANFLSGAIDHPVDPPPPVDPPAPVDPPPPVGRGSLQRPNPSFPSFGESVWSSSFAGGW